MNNPVVRVTLELEVPPPASEAEGYALGVLTGHDVTYALKQSLGCRIRHINSRELIVPAAPAGAIEPEPVVISWGVLPQGPGHVVVGIYKDEDGRTYVGAYHGHQTARCLSKYPWVPSDGHVLDLVQRVSKEAYVKGALAVSASSTVDFWEEAIA